MISGNHHIDVEYGNVIIQGSPFRMKTFDPTKVMVTGVKDGVIGKQSSFVGMYFGVYILNQSSFQNRATLILHYVVCTL